MLTKIALTFPNRMSAVSHAAPPVLTNQVAAKILQAALVESTPAAMAKTHMNWLKSSGAEPGIRETPKLSFEMAQNRYGPGLLENDYGKAKRTFAFPVDSQLRPLLAPESERIFRMIEAVDGRGEVASTIRSNNEASIVGVRDVIQNWVEGKPLKPILGADDYLAASLHEHPNAGASPPAQAAPKLSDLPVSAAKLALKALNQRRAELREYAVHLSAVAAKGGKAGDVAARIEGNAALTGAHDALGVAHDQFIAYRERTGTYYDKAQAVPYQDLPASVALLDADPIRASLDASYEGLKAFIAKKS